MNSWERKRIVIIDDDEEFGRRAARALVEAGFVARFHRGPHGTLQIVQETACDVVLLDVNMPQIDGPRLVRMIREAFIASTIRIVLCSDMHEGALMRLAKRFGADTAIQKPDQMQTLVDALQALLVTPLPSRGRLPWQPSIPEVDDEPDPLSMACNCDAEVDLEPPDLVVVKPRGIVSGTCLSRVEACAGLRPYFLFLFDMSGAVALDASARAFLSSWASRVPCYAMAVHGADFHIQVIFEMIQRAASRLRGKPVLHHFASDEADARAWLERMRPVVALK